MLSILSSTLRSVLIARLVEESCKTQEKPHIDVSISVINFVTETLPERCVRFSHLLQRLFIRFIRGLLCRPVMLLFRDARPDISIMGSSGTSRAGRSAVAHGVA